MDNLVPELVPVRYERSETAAIKASLDELGYAVIRSAATPAELEVARSRLWREKKQSKNIRFYPRYSRPDHHRPNLAPQSHTLISGDVSDGLPAGAEDLASTHGWDPADPRTWLDDHFANPSGGTTAGLEHADFIWYVRTLPGVLAGFAAAYGTDDLVAAYDRSAVNRPVECGEPSSELQYKRQLFPELSVENAEIMENCP